MNLLKIRNKKDLEFFRNVSLPVENGEDVSDLVSKMLNMLYSNNAIGVSAVMFGILKRIIIVDIQQHGKKPIVMINPEIIKRSDETVEFIESSILIDDFESNIKRSKNITVKYFDLDFNEMLIDANDLLSVCIQHQIDNLDGKLFIDYLDNKDEIINKITKMRIKNIIENIDVLRTKCEPIEKIDENVKETLNSMLGIMYDSKGIGLSANQIGIFKRLVVIDLQTDGIKSPIMLINPKIIRKSDDMIVSEEEGCLSVPGARANVNRHKEVTVEYTDLNGDKQIINADNLLSICLQHELDHLDGKLFVDYLSKLKRDNILKKVKKTLKI